MRVHPVLLVLLATVAVVLAINKQDGSRGGDDEMIMKKRITEAHMKPGQKIIGKTCGNEKISQVLLTDYKKNDGYAKIIAGGKGKYCTTVEFTSGTRGGVDYVWKHYGKKLKKAQSAYYR